MHQNRGACSPNRTGLSRERSRSPQGRGIPSESSVVPDTANPSTPRTPQTQPTQQHSANAQNPCTRSPSSLARHDPTRAKFPRNVSTLSGHSRCAYSPGVLSRQPRETSSHGWRDCLICVEKSPPSIKPAQPRGVAPCSGRPTPHHSTRTISPAKASAPTSGQSAPASVPRHRLLVWLCRTPSTTAGM